MKEKAQSKIKDKLPAMTRFFVDVTLEKTTNTLKLKLTSRNQSHRKNLIQKSNVAV